MRGTITANRLNVRARPDRGGLIVDTLRRDTVVDIVDRKANWFEINFRGQPAFIYSGYVDLLDRAFALKAIVRTGLLNVGDQPGLNGCVTGMLPRDAVVDVLGDHGEWYEIAFNGELGFNHSDYVELLAASKPMKGRVTAVLLNVRSRPSLQAPIAGQLSRDARIDIIAKTGEWLKIRFKGALAYVFGKYIDLVEEEATHDVPPDPSVIEEEEVPLIPRPVELEEEPRPEEAAIELACRLPVRGTAQKQKVACTWN